MRYPVISLFAILLIQTSWLQAAPPNIVLFLVDDLGWRDVGYMGSDYYRTPHIDQLAADSMIFTDAYANGPNCAPSRAALMSGMYSPRTRIYTVNSPERGRAEHRRLIPADNQTELAPSVVTLAELLQDAGYTTCHVGKWHLGKSRGPTSPQGQGFRDNFGGSASGHPRSYFSPYHNPALSDGPAEEYLTDRLTDEAIAFICANHDQPFFLNLSFYSVHTPIQPRPDLKNKTRQWPGGKHQNNADYAAMVAAVDENIGRILKALVDNSIHDNTIVIFTSDNGGHGGKTHMAPLRGSKGMLYEGGIRVPLLIRWPGITKPSVRTEQPVLLFDLYPTLVEAAGAKLPKSQPVDGVSLLPLLLGDTSVCDRALFWHFPAYLEADSGHTKKWRATPASVIRQENWKLIKHYETNTIELYNIDEDISETHNLASEQTGVVDKLINQLEKWQQSIGAPTRFELNPDYQGS